MPNCQKVHYNFGNLCLYVFWRWTLVIWITFFYENPILPITKKSKAYFLKFEHAWIYTFYYFLLRFWIWIKEIWIIEYWKTIIFKLWKEFKKCFIFSLFLFFLFEEEKRRRKKKTNNENTLIQENENDVFLDFSFLMMWKQSVKP